MGVKNPRNFRLRRVSVKIGHKKSITWGYGRFYLPKRRLRRAIKKVGNTENHDRVKWMQPLYESNGKLIERCQNVQNFACCALPKKLRSKTLQKDPCQEGGSFKNLENGDF